MNFGLSSGAFFHTGCERTSGSLFVVNVSLGEISEATVWSIVDNKSNSIEI